MVGVRVFNYVTTSQSVYGKAHSVCVCALITTRGGGGEALRVAAAGMRAPSRVRACAVQISYRRHRVVVCVWFFGGFNYSKCN